MTHLENTKVFIPSWDGESYEIHPEIATYAGGRTAICLWMEGEYGPEPFGKVTINMPEVHLNPGEVLVKDWAENEVIFSTLVEFGWLIPTGREVISGWVAPAVCRLGGPLAQVEVRI